MQIGDDGVALLGKALTNDHVIRKVGLAHAHMSDLGIQAFAAYLPQMNGLRYLDISGNAIGDDGAISLAKALEKSCSWY